MPSHETGLISALSSNDQKISEKSTSSGMNDDASGPFKVAHLLGLLSERSGGLNHSVSTLAKSLTAVGRIESHILGTLDRGSPPHDDHWGGAVHAHSIYGPANFHWSPTMPTALERIAPDVVDSHGVWMNISRVALKVHKKCGIPFVVTPHGMLDPWAVQRSSWRKRLVRRWFEDEHLARASAIRALNQDEAQAIRKFGVETPIAVIPNGIVAPDRDSVTDVDDRLFVLQFLGRIDPKKGLEPLLIAWSKVIREPSLSHWQLRVHGWGKPTYLQSLHRLVGELGIAESVDLAGPVFASQKDQILGSAAAFILPSYSEGLPMAVLEAWSLGTPVLMTRACNLPEGFSEGAAIEIAPDPNDIARRILDFIAMDSDDRRAMALAGRRLVNSKFRSNAVAENLERVYRWVAGLADAPSELMFDG